MRYVYSSTLCDYFGKFVNLNYNNQIYLFVSDTSINEHDRAMILKCDTTTHSGAKYRKNRKKTPNSKDSIVILILLSIFNSKHV